MQPTFYIPKTLSKECLKTLNIKNIEQISIEPTIYSKPVHCLDNTINYLKNNEGSLQYGWIFSMLGKFVIKRHAHVVIRSPHDNLICITPPEVPIKTQNFYRDNTVESLIINNKMPTQSFSITNTPIIQKFVTLENQAEHARLYGNQQALNSINLNKQQISKELISFMQKNTNRNDPCYCGSAKKYKQCCGK